MDFMKVIDQTVREIKREVNLKVLKIPEIEQKVLDATSNEPWGPHGSALAEIAQATKKFTECQMVMNVLWTRLIDTGRDWRHVYKVALLFLSFSMLSISSNQALAVVEYLVANRSERAIDDIIEHTFQISSLSGFEYVEPNGKDMGLNVRKKVETIVGLLNDKYKYKEFEIKLLQTVRSMFILRVHWTFNSSSGITYKSSSASYDSSSFQSNDRYKGPSSTKEGDMFKNSYKDRNRSGEEEFSKDYSSVSSQKAVSENQGKKRTTHYGRLAKERISKTTLQSLFSEPLITGLSVEAKNAPIYVEMLCRLVLQGHQQRQIILMITMVLLRISQSSSAPPNNPEDDFDDFNPRGTSTTGSAAASFNQVDFFGESLVGNLIDAPASIPAEVTSENSNTAEVDLFADATLVSVSSHVETAAGSQTQANADLFASHPIFPSAFSSTVDFLAALDPVPQTDTKSSNSDKINSNATDLFTAVPLNRMDQTCLVHSLLIVIHQEGISSRYWNCWWAKLWMIRKRDLPPQLTWEDPWLQFQVLVDTGLLLQQQWVQMPSQILANNNSLAASKNDFFTFFFSFSLLIFFLI
ncbi:hypothetical protein HHK36_025591 [Tetracentron sinense]|uniref:ENTH domain-containing protein n=1 Tax=Tetracentron sinense TaxID=13715 RepID=A0A834YJ05_TETSI|nr:hypothetical protein HHK36_025591 [Tetracentron sinense]